MSGSLLRSELLKVRSVRTTLGLTAAMAGLVAFAVLLHGFTLDVEFVAGADGQARVLEPGQLIGSLFGAIAGALIVTTEYRHGTIRTTFIVRPTRARVVGAKAVVALGVGALLGLLANAIALGGTWLALALRGVAWSVSTEDALGVLFGGTVGVALWAGLGLGLGGVIRNQVGAVLGLAAWLLFLERLFLGDLADLTVSRYLPGAAGAALTGQVPVDAGWLSVPAGGLLLAAYAVAAMTAGTLTVARRDV